MINRFYLNKSKRPCNGMCNAFCDCVPTVRKPPVDYSAYAQVSNHEQFCHSCKQMIPAGEKFTKCANWEYHYPDCPKAIVAYMGIKEGEKLIPVYSSVRWGR